MRVLGCLRISCLFVACFSLPAWAAVYSYTADGGEVYLSNVPVDVRYKVLIPGGGGVSAAEAVAAQTAPAGAVAQKSAFDPIIDQAARANELDSALLHAVISVESRYNPRAVSKKGAVGLMQLMPETAKRYGVSDAFDPVQNIRAGAQYLSYLLKIFNSDKRLALAAYNAGENAVIRSGNRIPRIRETANYVPRVLNSYQKYLIDL